MEFIKHRSIVLCVGLLAGMCSANAQGGSVSGSLALTSNYALRGLSQSRGDPALQGSLQYDSPLQWTVGVWGSTTRLDPRNSTRAEFDVYLSYRWTLSEDWRINTSFVRYIYPFDRKELEYDYNELVATLDYRNMAFFTVAWSPATARYSKQYYADANAVSYDVAWAAPLSRTFIANVGVGYYDLSDLFDRGYWYWSAGVGYERNGWHIAATYIGADAVAKQLFSPSVRVNGIVATVARRF